MVATNDGHYVRKEDAKAHDALLAIQTKKLISDEVRFKFPCEESFVKSPHEMAEAIPDSEYPGALDNPMVIADMCDVELPAGSKRVYQMPEVEVPAGRSLEEQLRAQSYEGMLSRYSDLDESLWRAYLKTAEPGLDADSMPLDDVFLALARKGEKGRVPAAEGATFGRYGYPHLEEFADSWPDAEAIVQARRVAGARRGSTASGLP